MFSYCRMCFSCTSVYTRISNARERARSLSTCIHWASLSPWRDEGLWRQVTVLRHSDARAHTHTHIPYVISAACACVRCRPCVRERERVCVLCGECVCVCKCVCNLCVVACRCSCVHGHVVGVAVTCNGRGDPRERARVCPAFLSCHLTASARITNVHLAFVLSVQCVVKTAWTHPARFVVV